MQYWHYWLKYSYLFCFESYFQRFINNDNDFWLSEVLFDFRLRSKNIWIAPKLLLSLKREVVYYYMGLQKVNFAFS